MLFSSFVYQQAYFNFNCFRTSYGFENAQAISESLDNVDENIAQIFHKHSIIMRTLYNVKSIVNSLPGIQRAVMKAHHGGSSLSRYSA